MYKLVSPGRESGTGASLSQRDYDRRTRDMSQTMDIPSAEQTGTAFRPTPKDDLIDANSLIGRKWQPVIVHQLLSDGPMGFSDLQQCIDSISSKVLSENLEALEEADLVARELVETRPLRVEYSLTPAGEALEPVLTAILDWCDTYRETVRGENE
jgi:DNA-binding HxlR family transcriptional regulator